MKILKRLSGAKGRIADEKLYERVAKEMAQGERREGLWAKAFSEENGDERRTEAKYIELRVQSLRDEQEMLAEAAIEEKEENKQRLIEKSQIILATRGYSVEEKGKGWVIQEPFGGTIRVKSAEELYEFASTRK